MFSSLVGTKVWALSHCEITPKLGEQMAFATIARTQPIVQQENPVYRRQYINSYLTSAPFVLIVAVNSSSVLLEAMNLLPRSIYTTGDAATGPTRGGTKTINASGTSGQSAGPTTCN